jgi:Zn finger protein HypA/HybF involved in hydrogenase expression
MLDLLSLERMTELVKLSLEIKPEIVLCLSCYDNFVFKSDHPFNEWVCDTCEATERGIGVDEL